MPIQIDKILACQGNKYERTSAIIQYARYLSKKHDDSLEIPVNRYYREKVTTLAINDILNGKITFTAETLPEEK